MHASLSNFSLVINSVLLWKLIVFVLFLGVSEALLCVRSAPQARRTSAANVAFSDVDVSETKTTSLNHVL
jgi:hypothetical protein